MLDYSLYKSLERIYRSEKPDFIFHYVIKPNIYGSLAAARCGIQSIAVITGLGYTFDRHNWLNRIVSILYRRALKKAGEVWFLNQEDAQVFIQRKLTSADKIKILPGEGINTSHFSPQENKPVARSKAFQFLMSTRLLKSKGVGVYVEAARILKNKYRDVRFELIGFFEKNHPDSISESEIRHWQKKGLIHYSGFARDVRPFLRQADCFVFPSFYHEGIPRCLLEAAAMEIPIITSLNTGCKEVVKEGVNGFLCSPNNVTNLATRMEEMMGLSSGQRAELGRNGRVLVTEKFGMEKILAEYDRALASIRV
jgi:glycosyltransferase involved in cell wall biosynthesis